MPKRIVPPRRSPPAEPVFLRSPDRVAVARLADDAARALAKLHAEVAADRAPDADPIELVAASMVRLGIEALRDLVIEREDPHVPTRRELVRAFGRLRSGAALTRALDVTDYFVTYARQNTTDSSACAGEYINELRRLDLDELGGRSVPDAVVAAELLGEVERRGGRPRGVETILARVLLLHRDGAIEQKQVDRLRDAIIKAERRRKAVVARVGGDDM